MTTPVIMPSAPSQQQVTSVYNTRVQQVRNAAAAFVAAQWASFPFYGPEQAAQFASVVVPTVQAAEQATGSLTAAYLHQILAMQGEPAAQIGVPPDVMSGAALRNGVDPKTVYRRPFQQTWNELDAGKDLDAAVKAGAGRAQSLVTTDLQLAKTHTAQHILAKQPRITGYRRELGDDPHHCALCLLTSSRIYHKAALLPMHPGCSCTPVPVVAGETVATPDPAQVHATIRRDLGQKYVQAGGRGPVNYRDIVIVHDHSELGPVLGVRGQHFQGRPDPMKQRGKR